MRIKYRYKAVLTLVVISILGIINHRQPLRSIALHAQDIRTERLGNKVVVMSFGIQNKLIHLLYILLDASNHSLQIILMTATIQKLRYMDHMHYVTLIN